MKYEKIEYEEYENEGMHKGITKALGKQTVRYSSEYYVEDIKIPKCEKIIGKYYDGNKYIIVVEDENIANICFIYEGMNAREDTQIIDNEGNIIENRTIVKLETGNIEIHDIDELQGFCIDHKSEMKGMEIKPGVIFAGAGEKAIKIELHNKDEFIRYSDFDLYPEIVEFIRTQMPKEDTLTVDTTEIKAIFRKAGRGYQTSQGTIDEILPSSVSIGGHRYGYSDEKTQQIVEEIKGGV